MYVFRKITFSLTLLSVIFTASCHYIDHSKFEFESVQVNPTRGQPWPYPQQYAAESTYFTLDKKSFFFDLHSSKCDIVVNALQRYQKTLFQTDCFNESYYQDASVSTNNLGPLASLYVWVQNPCEEYPYMNMDEQYVIKINTEDYAGKALLYGTTVWGVLRGLETFTQLVYQIQPGQFAVNTSIVLDYPRFSFRGILLDTSRHYIPKSILLQNLDAMAQTKMNVFHWHIVDDQSFPYVSKKFPSLSDKGAYNPSTHIYSQSDVSEVIEYARLRGIRVLVEFDTPGHTLSWGNGQTNLLTPCYSGSTPNGKFGPIDPTNDAVYTFLKSFFSEVGSVFPEQYIHLGGDEVDFECWKSNPNILNFMKKQKFGDNYALLEQYYMQKLLNIVQSLNKSYIVWQEVFDNGVKVKHDTVVHVWKDNYQSELSNVTAAGFQTILSSCWYLNYISYGDDWKNYYQCEPYDFKGTQDQKNLIIGGEACMWGEYVDGSNVITRTWPRAAAVAERLWSNRTMISVSSAAPRLEELRCNMIKRGLKVEPVNGPGYCKCDYLN